MSLTITDYRKQAVKLFQEDEIVDIYGQMELLEKEIASSLPVERTSEPGLSRRLAELQMHLFLGVTEYLPLEPLSWRNEKGEPIFGLFNPLGSDNVFRIQLEVDDGTRSLSIGRGDHWASGHMNLPAEISSHYQDMREHLDKRRPRNLFGFRRDARVLMRAQYTGMIPAEVRKQIRDASASNLFRNILTIFEAPEWSYDVLPVPQYRDPMVIGWAHDRAYLIASFMPTKAEQLWLDSSLPTGN